MAGISTNTQTLYTLTLTEDEAKALACVLSGVGGSPDKSRRGLIQSIVKSLDEANITFPALDALGWDTHGAIRFIDTDEAENHTWYTLRGKYGVPEPKIPYN